MLKYELNKIKRKSQEKLKLAKSDKEKKLIEKDTKNKIANLKSLYKTLNEYPGYPAERDFNPIKIERYLYDNVIDSFSLFAELIFNPRKHITPKEYWFGLRLAYADNTNNLYAVKEFVTDFFTSYDEHREYLMNLTEREKLKGLPEKIIIYRGMTIVEAEDGKIDPKKYGISWTLSKKVGMFFANEYIGNVTTSHMKKVVIEKTIPKHKVIAYIDERSEQEVIYLPWF